MAQALTAWARDQHLTEGRLTVLAIDPPLDGPAHLARGGHGEPEMLSLAFGDIRLTE